MNKKKNKNIFRRNQKPIKFGINWVFFLIFGLFVYILFSNRNTFGSKDVNWTEFQIFVQQNIFSEVIVNLHNNKVTAKIKSKVLLNNDTVRNLKSLNGTISTIVPSTEFTDFYKKMVAKYGINTKLKYEEGHNLLWYMFGNLLPVLFFAGIWIFIMRKMSGGGKSVFNVGKNKAQIYDKSSPNVEKITFKEVAGLSEAKQEIEEIVDFLKDSNKYTGLGAKIPKGVLLVGPPGTGKTLLARAVAGEANVPFFSMSGSDFVEMFVGVGASRVRDLFCQAKDKSPCIVFIDEIDAVGRARGRNPNMGANDERENTLNQLLTEMDGFSSNSGVIILAATNRVDILDKALLRAGRFDRQINVDLPELNDRKEIFIVHLRDIKIDDSVNMDLLARQSPGFSGADIANVCNEAALIAARIGKKFVQKEDFTNAIDRIIGGLEKKSKIITAEERKTIALHESGHATLSWVLEYASPLVKVTIVPRSKALGAAWYMPEERQITTYQQLQDELCATLGGRAAEELFLEKISTGAANDLERITKQAYAIVVYYGMSELLPNMNYYDVSGQDWGFHKPYSESTSCLIDKEVQRIIEEQYNRAKKMLTKYSKQHQQLTNILLDREVIYSDDLEQIFGKRKWISRSQEILEQQNISNKNTLND